MAARKKVPAVSAEVSSTEATAAPSTTPLTSAPPAWHTLALWVAVVSVCVACFPSLESMDEMATVEHFSNVLFPEYLDLSTVIYVRLLVALAIWFTSFWMVFLYEGWDQFTSYLPASKLISVPNRLSGIKTMFPFTSVSWNLLGASFSLNAYIAYQAAAGNAVNMWVLRAAVVAWDVAGPFTLLVGAVVRFAIWPAVLKRNPDGTKALKHWRNVMMHNMNVLFALTEVSFLGGLQIPWGHFPFAPMVGSLYLLFSWLMVFQWNDPKYGPQYIYFFFDTTLPGYTTSIALLALVVVLSLFFCIFCACDEVLELLGKNIFTHALFVGVICASVMRFRD